MRKRTNLLLLAIAMVLALLTTLVVSRQLSKTEAKLSTDETTSVVVVQKDVLPHTVVTSNDVAVQSIPKNSVQPGAVTSLSEVVGRYAATHWFAGQQVITPMVTAQSQPAAFPLQIPEGQRAYTIANDAVTGVDHLISPGDRIDIVVTSSGKSGGTGGSANTAKVLLQNVLVLYVDNAPAVESRTVMVNGSKDSSSSSSASSAKTVDTLTVALDPLDVAKLDYAETYGQLHIALRNPNDSDAPILPTVTDSVLK